MGAFWQRRSSVLAATAVLTAAAAVVLALRARDPGPRERASPDPPEPEGVAPAPPPPVHETTPREPGASLADVVERIVRAPVGAPPATLSEALARAQDPDAPLARRIASVRWLAAREELDAFLALERIAHDDAQPALLRAAVAEALGGASHPGAPRLLQTLLDADAPLVAAGAVRGLAVGATPEAVARLAGLVDDPQRPHAVRQAAARALGTLDPSRADEHLARLRADGGEEGLAEALLEGLAQDSFPEAEGLFHDLVHDPDVPMDLRVSALEALEEAGDDATSLLLETARSAGEPALRGAAVEALVGREDARVVPELLARLAAEPDPAVRAQLYAALAFDAPATRATARPGALLEQVAGEPGGPARLEGARLVARLLGGGAEPELASAFDRVLTPWLEQRATQARSAHQRLLAVDALGLGATPGAEDALHRLVRASDPGVAEAAHQQLARIRERSGSGSAP